MSTRVDVLKGKGVVVIGTDHTSADYRIEVFREHTLIDARGVIVTRPEVAQAILDHGDVQLELEDGARIEILATRCDPGGFVDFKVNSNLPGYA
jgi:hypothetical protein